MHNRRMRIRGIFDKKQDIEAGKQDIETGLLPHPQQQLEKITAAFGKQAFWGRGDIMRVLGITASPASSFIKKLLEAEKIEAVKGHGKGKYILK